MFGKTRQAYYKNKKSAFKESVAEDLLITLVMKVRERQKRLGGRKLLGIISPLLPDGEEIGRDAFFDLLRRNGMLVRKRRIRAFTTNSFHWLHKYPNLIKEFVPQRPHHLWVSDITYIKTAAGFVYLYLITDAYSRKIIGWHISETMEAQNALEALYMALSQLPADVNEIIHHSDRGIQYCSSRYVNCLQKHGARISMTEHSDPYENAIAERVNGILKTEWLYDMALKNCAYAKDAVSEIIDIYNAERPHSSIEMLTPNQAHQRTGALMRLWKTYQRRKQEEVFAEI
ncbi:MAG: IS3 family transposase [Tenuifilaceae bacterium]